MPGNILTSVIIPARNAASTLAAALDSLIAQSDGRWEAIIVDDGSSDGTASIAVHYVERDPRFRLVQGNRRGAGAARNEGLAHAAGDRILFLDSDDWIHPDFVDAMGELLQRDPDATAAYCGYRRVFAGGLAGPIKTEPSVALDPANAFLSRCPVAIHSVLVRRSALDRAGAFDPDLATCEDWELWQRVSKLGGNWIFLDRALSFYRTSGSSLTQSTDQLFSDGLEVIRRGFADEANSRPAEMAIANLAVWCASIDSGAGRAAPLNDVAKASLKTVSEEPLARLPAILDGLVVGAQCPPEALAQAWIGFTPGLLQLLSELASVWGNEREARSLQYALERKLLDLDGLAEPRSLTLTHGARVDIRSRAVIPVSAHVDRLALHLYNRETFLGVADCAALGSISVTEWQPAAAMVLGRAAMERLPLASIGDQSGPSEHAVLLRELRQSIADEIRTQAVPAGDEPPGERRRSGTEEARPTGAGSEREAFWEKIFEAPDPWDYGSPYEQEKYELQLRLLPEKVETALELACAEGKFTAQLAPRVGRLVAADISTRALGRARERCDAHDVEFIQLDLREDALPHSLDLITCSEVLYYLSDEDELRTVAARIGQALKPGGHLISAHAFVVPDSNGRTAFDWDNPFGADTIARVFGELDGFALDRSLQTDLYRVDRFVKLSVGEAAPPEVQEVTRAAPLSADVAKMVIWGGAVARRSDVASERRSFAPVLMYHRIAETGPEELARYRTSPSVFEGQMRWLRRNGFHAIVSEQLRWFIDNREEFHGRPVLITFDDAYQDFADHAWPILQWHDLIAECFVVTGAVGGSSDWDDKYGPPADLIDVPTIRRLAQEGAFFGSHFAHHLRSDGLSARELADELIRSREQLAHWLGYEPFAVAAPFGRIDGRVRQLARECGYGALFGTQTGAASIDHNPFDLPRIEVAGDWSEADFAAAMESLL